MNNHNPLATFRLTALWALSESGLGGLMHAVKIPFTGFFLGGFAIVIVTLIGQLNRNQFQSIMQATFLVLLVKAAASPHSPPMAYIAVVFQGLAGAIVFTVIRYRHLAAMVFGGIALLESALQKFLVATLIFGKSIWDALDSFIASILKDLSFIAEFSFSFWLIATYTALYLCWGLWLGWWSAGLFERLQLQKEEVLQRFRNLPAIVHSKNDNVPSKRKSKLLVTALVLAFIVSVFVAANDQHKALYAIIRTLAALALLFWVVTPLVQWAVQYWVKRKKESSQMVALLEQLPELKSYVKPALQLAQQQQKGIRVYPVFVQNLLLLALYAK